MDILTYAMAVMAAKKSGGGGGGTTTAFSVEVGTMEQYEGGFYIYEGTMTAPTLDSSKAYYWGSTDIPLVAPELEGFVILCHNFDIEEGPINPESPSYLMYWSEGKVVVQTSDDISDTTVHILATAASGGGGAEYFYVTISVDASGEEPVYSADKTVAEIYAAKQANKIIVARYEIEESATIELPCVVCNEEAVEFSVTVAMESNSLITIVGMSDDDRDRWAKFEISIPYADASDNGKILSAYDGEYVLRDSPAPLIVHVTNDNGTWVSDITPAQIVAARAADKTVYIDTEDDGVHYIGLVTLADEIDSDVTVVASAFMNERGGYYATSAVYAEGSWSVSDETMHLLPESSSAEAGRVLQINAQGEWAAEAIPIPYLVHFSVSEVGGKRHYETTETCAQIKAAIDAGRIVYANLVIVSEGMTLTFPVQVEAFVTNGTTINSMVVSVYDDAIATTYRNHITLTAATQNSVFSYTEP